MVLKKKQQYHGFNGFYFPTVPKAPRSARRSFHKRIVDDSQICAFELLASLAGKLLQETESSSASSNASDANDRPAICDDVVKGEQVEKRPVKGDCFDLGRSEESIFLPDDSRGTINKIPPPAESERSSIVSNSDSSEKISSEVKPTLPAKVELVSAVAMELSNGTPQNGFRRQPLADGLDTRGLILDNACSSKVLMDSCRKNPALIELDNTVNLLSRRNSLHNASDLKHGDKVKLGIIDDDEKLFRFYKQSNKRKSFRPSSRIGDRRIRKLLSSKYWTAAPRLKDYELTKPAFEDAGIMKPLYHKRKLSITREKHQSDILYKRRKFSDNNLIIASDGGFSSESVCNSPEKGTSGDISAVMLHGENGMSSPAISHQAQLNSKDSHVKVNIKSFKIPELLIEVPETATVGSLKRTVMEAVTAILGGALHVGVLVHGEKVRDDNRTLLQTGITSSENLDTLGFTLEPSSVQASTPLCPEAPPAILPCHTSQLISRSPATRVVDLETKDSPFHPSPPTSQVENDETNGEAISTNIDIVAEKAPSDSRALVAVEPITTEALNVVPLNQKCRRSENVQRRTRRPFSVSEVEALVQAVEELGTGRWRDVKLRSFDNADHRTYVDLKDKWKTLVHTAKIAPQQRRGEPVPQNLLDRVLAAHGYWSQHQAKQQCKNEASSTVMQISEGQAV
ncbi:Telomere repeat-binding protein 4 [Linum grandiflorum]